MKWNKTTKKFEKNIKSRIRKIIKFKWFTDILIFNTQPYIRGMKNEIQFKKKIIFFFYYWTSVDIDLVEYNKNNPYCSIYNSWSIQKQTKTKKWEKN